MGVAQSRLKEELVKLQGIPPVYHLQEVEYQLQTSEPTVGLGLKLAQDILHIW